MDVLWAPWRMELIEQGGSDQRECIFCRFPGDGDDARHLIVHRGDAGFVILNRFPYSSGHVMVVPYAHAADPGELAPEAWASLAGLLRHTVALVGESFHAQGMNVGMNLGAAGGAGIPGHMHWHVVPRWVGDTNFMPVLGDTKVMPEHLVRTWEKLVAAFRRSG